MKDIDTNSEIVKTDFDNLEYITEVAYGNLMDNAIKYKLLSMNVKPAFMQLPEQALTQNFKDACAAIVNALRKAEGQEEVKPPTE